MAQLSLAVDLVALEESVREGHRVELHTRAGRAYAISPSDQTIRPLNQSGDRRMGHRHRHRDRTHLAHLPVAEELRIDVKEDRHVDGLARQQALLIKAEALDLVEVGANLVGHNIVPADGIMTKNTSGMADSHAGTLSPGRSAGADCLDLASGIGLRTSQHR